MKDGIIFARKSTWRSRLDLEYLDETSERKVSQRASASNADVEKSAIGRKLRQFARLRLEGNARTGSCGRISSHLIRVNADGTSTAPSQADATTRRKKRISEAWFQHIRKFPTSSTESRHSASPRLFHVAGTARQARCGRHQSRPRVAVHHEEGHGEIRASDFIRLTPSDTPTAFITTRTISTSMSRFARAPQEARTSDAARHGLRHRDTRIK